MGNILPVLKKYIPIALNKPWQAPKNSQVLEKTTKAPTIEQVFWISSKLFFSPLRICDEWNEGEDLNLAIQFRHLATNLLSNLMLPKNLPSETQNISFVKANQQINIQNIKKNTTKWKYQISP